MSVVDQLGALATRVGQECKAIYTALGLKANDSAVVHKTGAETIQGNKSVPAGSGNEWAFNQPVQVAVGTQSYHAVRRDDSRLTDTRTPSDSSVTDAKVAAGAAIAESKLSLASDAAAGTASRRSLGTGATQAAAGDHAHAGLTLAAQPGTSLWAAGNAEAFPRLGSNLNLPVTSGMLTCDYFFAPVTVTISKLGFNTNAAGGSGLTVCRLALFTVASDDAVTKVAQTANTTSMGAASYSVYQGALNTTGGFPASYTLTAGMRYAIGMLQVGTTPSSACGVDCGTGQSLAPVICRRVGSQTDIGASYTAAQMQPFYNAPWLFAAA